LQHTDEEFWVEVMKPTLQTQTSTMTNLCCYRTVWKIRIKNPTV